ncbi:MAG TPA: GNAT family N-acetyltransferase [Dongiaceae bacterium]|nr:GNAT family N-acetyltransferase [Dongiaceae bacterium]
MPEDSRLETERLLLREPVADDAPALLAYHRRNDERLARWDPRRGDAPADHEAWIAARVAASRAGRARSWLAFDRAAGNALAGEVQLDSITSEPQHTAMLAYSVDGAYEGKGYAHEAVGAVVAYAFERLDLRSLTATYDPANERSGALLRRLGFVEVARTAVIPGFERHMRAQVLMRLGRPTAPA